MAAYASNLSDEDCLSEDQTYRMMTRDNYTRRDWRFIFLSDALEHTFAHILQHGYDIDHVEKPPANAQYIKDQILAWARHIQEDVPGYATWEETYEFTFDALHKPDAIPGEDPTPIGTEQDFWSQYFDDDMKHRYGLKDSAVERAKLNDHAGSLATARLRLDILDGFRKSYAADTPMPESLAILFRKIRYTHKLREALLRHVGYFNGSLELAAEIPDGIHRHMYLLDLKLRRPDRIHLFRAPKQYICYQTDPGSELPWNNQFSFCYGYHMFGPSAMPRWWVKFIERRLVDVIRGDKDGQKWTQLCTLMSWDSKAYSSERSWIIEQQFQLQRSLTLADCGFVHLNLQNIIRQLSGPLSANEFKLKDFYWHVLSLPRSDTKLSSANVASHIDSRIVKMGEPPLLTLSGATHHPIILEPHSAQNDFHNKLTLMNEAQLDMLFNNIPDYPRHLSHTQKSLLLLIRLLTQPVPGSPWPMPIAGQCTLAQAMICSRMPVYSIIMLLTAQTPTTTPPPSSFA